MTSTTRDDEHPEDCACTGCTSARAEFEQWCSDTERRWAAALWNGRVKDHLDCGPLCSTHGDVRDTSIDVVRLGVAVR